MDVGSIWSTYICLSFGCVNKSNQDDKISFQQTRYRDKIQLQPILNHFLQHLSMSNEIQIPS